MPLSPHLPPLSALELLVDVARTSSIGAAARTHGISQQAASERLRSIEAQVGLSLVVRGPRGSSLTPAGTVMVEWAARLLDVAGEIDAASAPDVGTMIERRAAGYRQVVLDLTGVDFFGTAGRRLPALTVTGTQGMPAQAR